MTSTDTTADATATTDEALMMAFTRAVAARSGKVRLIDANNAAVEADWTARAPGSAFSVYLASAGRYTTIALDFDCKHGNADNAQLHATHAKRLLSAAGLRPVMVASGPSGGRHVLVTLNGAGVSSGDARRLAHGLRNLGLTTLDVTPLCNWRTGSIRPPFSPHRLGGRSVVMGDDAEAFNSLHLRSDPNGARWLLRHLPSPIRRRVSAPTDTATSPVSVLLEAGPLPEQYNSGSEAVQALITSYVNRRLCRADLEDAIRTADPESPIAMALNPKSAAECDNFLAKSWDRAVRFVAEKPAQAKGSRWTDAEILTAWSASLPTADVSTFTARCATGVLELAVGHERAMIGLSVRDLATRVGVSTSTASKALNEMVDSGLIQAVAKAAGGQARRFRMQHPEDWTCMWRTVSSSPSMGGVGMQTVRHMHASVQLAEDVSHDIWRRGGLGEELRLVYVSLAYASATGTGVRVARMAEETGVTPGHVRRRLNVLQGVGLARRCDPGVWVAEFREGDEVADLLGVRGEGQRQAQSIAEDRLRWRVDGVLLALQRDRETGQSPLSTAMPPV